MFTTALAMIIPVFLFGAPQGALAPFVPGEILVRFAPVSGGAEAVARASRSSPPDLKALNPVIDNLETAAHVPLSVKQLSSGDWVVLAVNSDRLTERAAHQLRERRNVAVVQVSPCEPEASAHCPPPKKLVIRFVPGAPEAEAVSKKLTGTDDAAFAQLTAALTKELDLPLAAKATDAATIQAQIDLRALTMTLIERLKALPDIEAAQPNFILTFK
jgi:hypothetical protein